MSLVSLEGLDEATLEKINPEASGGGRPFPCDAAGYTKHTGRVTKCRLHCFDDGGESIVITVENEGHTGDVLVSLDCSGAPDPQKAIVSRNRAIKVLGAHTDGKLDTGKLEKASGQLIEFSAKHKGFTTGKNGGTFHKVALYFNGEVKALRPVTGPAMPALPGSRETAPTQGSSLADIPF